MSGDRRVDLNSDLGESFGAYRIGDDAALLGLISSANVACGFHGGDPRVMAATVVAARDRGVAVGAHPGYSDLVGFGRRDLAASPTEIRADVLYQLGALGGFCRAAGVPLRHVKAHGALSNRAVSDAATAAAFVAAVEAYDAALIVLSQPGALVDAAEGAGLRVAREAFADRAYNADGTLVSRRLPGALITDPDEAAERMARLLAEGVLPTVGGPDLVLAADSICVHADTPGAAAIMGAVRARLVADGATIRPAGEA